MFSLSKRTTRSNYLPYTVSNQSYSKWKRYYDQELDDMYCVFIDTMNSRFPEIDLIRDDYFELFCRMIFDTSSKYIDRRHLN